jgi:hypothetical protein
MAATRLVSGKLREIWQEAAGQPGGPPVEITTDIRINRVQFSRVRGRLFIDGIVGAPIPSASADIATNGCLLVRIFNGVGGSSFTWTLDVELTHSVQQATDPLPDAEIQVVNGMVTGGVAAAQTLAQTYDFGAAAVDQRLVLDTAKGGGVVIEGSTAAVLGNGVSLEVRQNSTWAVPILVGRRGDISSGPNLQFAKARGTFVAPDQVTTNDEMGVIDFYGYTAGAMGRFAGITAPVINVGAGPGFEVRSAIDFYTSYGSVINKAFRMRMNGAGGGGILECIGDGLILPDVDNQGQLGSPVSNSWAALSVYTAYVLANIRMGGTTMVAGTSHAIVFPNDAVLPVPTANQVYVGSNDWTPSGGSFYAALSISAEALINEDQGAEDYDVGVPLVYNGKNYLLLARDLFPG